MVLTVSLRAFVPHLTPQSLAVAFRMLDRAQLYSQYAVYWQSRPQQPVSKSPSRWWQHAGSAAARECKLISRRQVRVIDEVVKCRGTGCQLLLQHGDVRVSAGSKKGLERGKTLRYGCGCW